MTARVNALFQALSFNAEYRMLPIGYDREESDVDRILDAVARSSAVITMPDCDPDRWEVWKRHLSEQDIANLNHYRRKFSMSDVP